MFTTCYINYTVVFFELELVCYVHKFLLENVVLNCSTCTSEHICAIAKDFSLFCQNPPLRLAARNFKIVRTICRFLYLTKLDILSSRSLDIIAYSPYWLIFAYKAIVVFCTKDLDSFYPSSLLNCHKFTMVIRWLVVFASDFSRKFCNRVIDWELDAHLLIWIQVKDLFFRICIKYCSF